MSFHAKVWDQSPFLFRPQHYLGKDTSLSVSFIFYFYFSDFYFDVVPGEGKKVLDGPGLVRYCDCTDQLMCLFFVFLKYYGMFVLHAKWHFNHTN